jgi:hypothetical protein
MLYHELYDMWPVSLFISILKMTSLLQVVGNDLEKDVAGLRRVMRHDLHFFSGCPNQEIGCPFLFKDLMIETCLYFGTDSAT